MNIDTPLLVVGPGPAALLVAKLASGRGLASVIAGHEITGAEDPVELDAAALAVLSPHGLLDVLRPYLASHHPVAIAPAVFEEVVKHHCVADMNITVYDGLTLVEAEPTPTGGVRGDPSQRAQSVRQCEGKRSDHQRAGPVIKAGRVARCNRPAFLPERGLQFGKRLGGSVPAG